MDKFQGENKIASHRKPDCVYSINT